MWIIPHKGTEDQHLPLIQSRNRLLTNQINGGEYAEKPPHTPKHGVEKKKVHPQFRVDLIPEQHHAILEGNKVGHPAKLFMQRKRPNICCHHVVFLSTYTKIALRGGGVVEVVRFS
jgi:hypothetical protein